MRHIWLLFILLVIVSGCGVTLTQTAQPKNEAAETSSNQPGRLANRGIELDFIHGKPTQDRIILGERFSVSVLLRNWATETISGQIKLSDTIAGSDIEAIKGVKTTSFTISGVDEEAKPLKPKEKRIDFDEFFTYDDPRLTKTIIRAEVEYDYKVKFTIPICVKTENAIASESECTSRRNFGVSDFGFNAQHAPVTITNIRQEIDATGDSGYIILYLLFEDFGGTSGGTRGWINNNDRSIDLSNSVIELAGQGKFKCNKNVLTFPDSIKKREVSCILPITFNLEDVERENFFQNPLEIEFSYPYKIIVPTAEIPIKKPLEERNFFAEEDEAFEAVG
ncbi:hypothetical protein HYX17_00740 [Candidatus Woesearchaeota archaeon]|nr:hypothetical protein [Candidatus Woesearchaeota archaeon]